MKQSGSVLYEDNHLVAINKPPGLLTQADDSGRPDLESQLRQHHRFLHAIFRLDRVASGLVLFARSSKALSRLNDMQRNRQFRKTYLAIVAGTTPSQATWEDLLLHADHRASISPHGKPARLTLRTIASKRGYSLVEIDLHTGRYHQIRCQFSSRGHPIVGDTKYGSAIQSDTIALHHLRLAFTHPVQKTPLLLTAPCGPLMAVLEGLFEQEAAHQAASQPQSHL